jgi:hypothetical protein
MNKALILILFFVISNYTAAQDVELTVDHPTVVSAGQSFSVVYSVNAGGGEFTVPSFTGFSKLMGPQTSYSQSAQNINGKITRQTSYSYTYYIQAQKPGKFVIPPAVFKLKNREYKSDSLRIEVVADASQAGKGTEEEKGQAAASGDLFVNMLLNRREVYVGEPVTATVKLFTKVDLQGINEIKYPSFNNFLRTDIDTPPLTSLQEENVNGSIYGTGIIQKFLLYPQVPGEVIIDPVQITVLVQQRSGSSDPFFGDFFSSYQTVPKTIASKPISVRVKPLPGAKPDDFSGIVGNLDITASLGSDSVNVNEALNFRITINGSGNLRIASAPKINLPPDLEVYDPKITDNLKSGSSGTQGSKSFEYLIIPRHHGSFSIPPVTYSFFNTNTGRYETLKTEEFTFHARRADDQASGITVFSGISKEDVKYLSKDIRFIKSETEKFETSAIVLTANRWFYSLYGITFLTFLLILVVRKEHVRRNSDLSIVRNRKAGKVAGRRLRTAESCLKNNQIDKFYEEILKALWGYLSDKLNIPMSELTRVNAISTLTSRGVDDSLTGTLNNILDTCEYARFAPSASGTEAGKIFDGASKFIRSVENTIR